MDYTVHFGTWVIPMFLTIIFYLVGYFTARDDDWGIARLFFAMLATIASLAAWLVWALLR
jgi:hypothetical protein